MRNRLVRVLATAGFGLLATACGGGGAGKILADTPVLPYQAPDIDEITGIDPDEEPAAPTPMPEPAAAAPTPAATPAPAPVAPVPAKVTPATKATPTPKATPKPKATPPAGRGAT